MGETGLNTELFFILRGTGRSGDKQVNQVVRSNVRLMDISQVWTYHPTLLGQDRQHINRKFSPLEEVVRVIS